MVAVRLPWFSKSPEKVRAHPALAAFMILLVGLGLTAVISYLGQRQASDRIQARVERQVQRTYLSMQEHLFAYEGLLRGGRGLFEVRDQLGAASWKRFVDELDLPHRYPAVKGLAFIERAEEPGAKDKCLIRYSEPAALNPHAVGYDIALDPEQLGAAERSRDSGMSAITAPIYFKDSGRERPAFGLMLPIYQAGQATSTEEERHKAHLGWISAAIFLDTMMDEVMREMDPDFGTQIYGGNHPVHGGLAYQHNMGPMDGIPRPNHTRTPYRQLNFQWGDRAWVGRVIPLPSFDAAADYRWPTWALFTGGLISLLLALLSWSLISTRARAEAIAKAMTAALGSALRRHENHVQNTPLGVLEWDVDRIIRTWNPAATRIFKFEESEAVGHALDDLLASPEHSPELNGALEQIQHSKVGNQSSLVCRDKQGGSVFCIWYSAPLLNEDGEFLGATTLIEDLTRARQREEALRQGQKLESLGLLAGGIAHDFNNILTALLGNLDAAVEVLDERSPALEHIVRALTSTERASDLSRQILVYSGKGVCETREVLLNQVVEEMSELLAVSRPPGVSLKLQLPPDLAYIQADPVQMQQVVMNLILNATEAIQGRGDGVGQITLRTSSRVYSDVELETAFPGQGLGPGPYVNLRVKDNGCGMDEATRLRVCDPFFTTKATGRGLGLSTLQGIVKAHRGGLMVNSQEGAGTTFSLVFPSTEVVPQWPLEAAVSAHYQSAGTVLLADDEEAIRSITALALSRAGFEVLIASDGDEALRIFKEHADIIGCALLDQVMPGQNGDLVMKALKAQKPGLRVILCSGHSLGGGADMEGADGFLQKPYRIVEVVELIRKVMGKA